MGHFCATRAIVFLPLAYLFSWPHLEVDATANMELKMSQGAGGQRVGNPSHWSLASSLSLPCQSQGLRLEARLSVIPRAQSRPKRMSSGHRSSWRQVSRLGVASPTCLTVGFSLALKLCPPMFTLTLLLSQPFPGLQLIPHFSCFPPQRMEVRTLGKEKHKSQSQKQALPSVLLPPGWPPDSQGRAPSPQGTRVAFQLPVSHSRSSWVWWR